MATETRKVLAQVDLPITSLYTIYTVPAATQAVVSTIYVCNLDAAPAVFRISVAPSGNPDAPSQYIYYDVTIPANETFAATTGMTLGVGDEIRGYMAGVAISVTIFGVEIT